MKKRQFKRKAKKYCNGKNISNNNNKYNYNYNYNNCTNTNTNTTSSANTNTSTQPHSSKQNQYHAFISFRDTTHKHHQRSLYNNTTAVAIPRRPGRPREGRTRPRCSS